MGIVEQLLELARSQIETKEFPPGSNNVKYNTAYYGREVNGSNFAWCAVFIWWLFRECEVSGLYFGGKKSAYVPALVDWARREGLLAKEPRPGDLVCFEFNGRNGADHIGICEDWDGEYVTTIDGNTGTTSQANGGCVMRRRRHRQYIAAVIRPGYEEVEENMTDEKFDRLMEGWLARQAGKGPEAIWQKEGLARAKAAGVTDGSRPMAFCTRLEAAMMAANAKKQ